MKTLTLPVLSIALMLFLGLVQSSDKYIYSSTHTRTFASHKYHDFPTLNDKAKGGLAAGFVVLGSMLIFACTMIVKEEIDKHNDMKIKIASAHKKMLGLGLNIDKIDQEYEVLLKNKGKSEDEDKVIQKAAQKKKDNKKQHQHVVYEEQTHPDKFEND